MDALSARLEASGASAADMPTPLLARLAKSGGIALAAGLLLWKLKFLLVLIATKGKLLLLGLTKTSTLFSMVLSLGVYRSVWGLPFAAGIPARWASSCSCSRRWACCARSRCPA